MYIKERETEQMWMVNDLRDLSHFENGIKLLLLFVVDDDRFGGGGGGGDK